MLSLFKKKPITGYPRSFAKRLTWRIMIRMILIMIIPVLLLFWLTYSIVALGVLGISNRILKGENEVVRRIASDLYMASTNTAAFIEDDLSNPDRMYDIMNRMVKLNPYMAVAASTSSRATILRRDACLLPTPSGATASSWSHRMLATRAMTM